ncbi:MAG: hypothetical protein OXG44_04280 [Gammaproteobacteria bacterium]|nr:hypothetical protein [Gammaproteobacteria bacterium]
MAEYDNQRAPQIDEFQYQLVYRSNWLRLFNQDWADTWRRAVSFTAPGWLGTRASVDGPKDAEALETGPTFRKAHLTDGPEITRQFVRGYGSFNPYLEIEQLGGAQIRQLMADDVARVMASGISIGTGAAGSENDKAVSGEDADAIDPRIRKMVTGVTYDNSTGKGRSVSVGTAGASGAFIGVPSGNSPPDVGGAAARKDEALALVRTGVAEALYLLRSAKIVGEGVEGVQGPGAPTGYTAVIPLGLQWILNRYLAEVNTAGGQFITPQTSEDAVLNLGIRGTAAFAGMFPFLGVDVMVDLNLPNATSGAPWYMYLVPGGSRALWAGVEIDDFITTGPQDQTDHARIWKMSSVGRLSAAVLRPDHLVRIAIAQK